MSEPDREAPAAIDAELRQRLDELAREETPERLLALARRLQDLMRRKDGADEA